MIAGKTVLAIIPARGGSKGVPRKNLRAVKGKPLLVWTIDEAKKSKYIDKLIISSEDSEILSVAREFGCEVPFTRPKELATDEAPGIAPVLHAIENLNSFDFVVLLQPTSPLRSAEDIDKCLEECMARNASACVSVTEAEQSPYWMFNLNSDARMAPLIAVNKGFERRQDLPAAYVLNGAVYVARCEWIKDTKTFVTKETVAYVMPQSRSLDIDTEADLKFLEQSI